MKVERRLFRIGIIVVSASIVATAVANQLMVPDIESAEKKVFSGFAELERLNAFVLASDGTSLGLIKKGFDKNDLGNAYGKGSRYDTSGLFNPYSDYGSKYSMKSAFNDIASDPPEIFVRQGGSTYSVGLLTTNKNVATKGQRINPYLLKMYLGIE